MFVVERHTPLPNRVRFTLVDYSTGVGRAICCGQKEELDRLKDMQNEKYKTNPERLARQGPTNYPTASYQPGAVTDL